MCRLSSAAGIRDFDICFKGLGLTKGKHHTGHGGGQNGMDATVYLFHSPVSL